MNVVNSQISPFPNYFATVSIYALELFPSIVSA